MLAADALVADAVDAEFLLAVQRALTTIDQVSGLLHFGRALGNVDRESEGGGDRDLLALEVRAQLVDALTKAFRQPLRARKLRLAEQDGELVAAHARDHVGASDHALQHLRAAP